jgi:epoxyqueuosine reductase QueG
MVAVQYMDMIVMRRMDKIAYKLADALERAGHPTFITAAQETDWNMKKASYGHLSTRHLGVEAGLGTLGLEVNILTPEYGPRLYLTGILTELELEPDAPMTEQVCIGEGCSRCLYACPADAVGHFDIIKPACASKAQEFGYMTVTNFFRKFVAESRERKRELLKARDLFGFWQGFLRVVGSFGDCPRCLAVCPVGNDYHAFLAEHQKAIPEKTPEKVALGKQFQAARKAGEEVPGLNDWNLRWVGPDGYSGRSAKQTKEAFRAAQRQRAAETAAAGGHGEER